MRLSSSMCFCLCVNEGGETRGELQPTGYLHRLDEVSLMYGFNLDKLPSVLIFRFHFPPLV